MANNTSYQTAGLPVAKDTGQSPSANQNTAYKTAGLSPIVLAGSILKISGVTWANTSKVSSVAKASIKKISSVSAV